MLVDNLNFQPIRLGLRRLSKDLFEITRDGTLLGSVQHFKGTWRVKGSRSLRNEAPSFRTAVLRLARQGTTVLRMVRQGTHMSTDGPQSLGQVRRIRVDTGGCWYTVLFDKSGRYIYEDHTLDKFLSPAKQAEVQAVLVVADKFAKENL